MRETTKDRLYLGTLKRFINLLIFMNTQLLLNHDIDQGEKRGKDIISNGGEK